MRKLTTDSGLQNTTTVLGKPGSWTQFRTAQEFSLHILTIAAETEMSCTDAILQFCDAHGLEAKDIAHKVDSVLRDKLAEEYRKIGYLPRVPSL